MAMKVFFRRSYFSTRVMFGPFSFRTIVLSGPYYCLSFLYEWDFLNETVEQAMAPNECRNVSHCERSTSLN